MLYAAGSADLTGIWRVRAGSATRIVPLPANALPNGLALDQRTGSLYVADSALGVVWKASIHGGAATVWASGAALAPVAFLGANGLKVHDGSVWVSNTDLGTIVRIPITADGSAGAVVTAETGLPTIDDFTFTPRGAIVVALDRDNEVVLVRPHGTQTVLLTAADGLQGPTSIALGPDPDTVLVASAAYTTLVDPNLLSAQVR